MLQNYPNFWFYPYIRYEYGPGRIVDITLKLFRALTKWTFLYVGLHI